jgi:hypothetical protein
MLIIIEAGSALVGLKGKSGCSKRACTLDNLSKGTQIDQTRNLVDVRKRLRPTKRVLLT